MKKIISVLLVAVLLMSGVSSYAQEADVMQEVLLSVKERIMDTDDFEEFNSSVIESDSQKLYEFYWSTNNDDNYKNLSVTVTESGIITNYRFYDNQSYSNSSPTINKMSSDDALLMAQALADRLNPMLKSEIKAEKMDITESLFNNEFRFDLQRYQNSVPVYNNSGYITVNNDATMITRYSLSYAEDLNFNDNDSIISPVDAWKYYYENAGAELLYMTEYKDGEKKISLVYVPQMSSDEYIDSKTGEVKKIWYRDYYFNTKYSAGSGSSQDVAVNESAKLTEIETNKLEEVSGLKSKEDAEKAIINNDILEFDDDLVLSSVNLYKDYNSEKYLYDLSFAADMTEEYRYARATLDAKTLEIIRWNSGTKSYIEYNKIDDKKQKLDEKVIENALNKIAPKYFSDDMDFRKEENDTNTVSYKRYVNNLRFTDDYITAEINPENGKLWRFSVNYTDMEFPSPEDIISEEDAINKMSENTEMKLYYFTYGKDEGAKKADSAESGYKTVDYIDKIDAFTGEINTYSSSGMPEYDDIDGHYAENAIKTLAKYGIGFESDEFKPDELITQEEYVTLLISTFSNYSPLVYAKSNELTQEYKQAQRNGIIKSDDVSPEEPLSREKAATYLIRIMGVEDIAKLDGIYKSKFNDVLENIGYISILNAMGVFNGDENGNFNPNKNLTRADAMIVIYNYLNR